MNTFFVGFLIFLSMNQMANASCDKNTRLTELPVDKKIVSVVLQKDLTIGAFSKGFLVGDIALILRKIKDHPQLLQAGHRIRLYRIAYAFLYAYDQEFEYFAFHAGQGRAEWIRNQTIQDFEEASNNTLGVLCESFE